MDMTMAMDLVITLLLDQDGLMVLEATILFGILTIQIIIGVLVFIIHFITLLIFMDITDHILEITHIGFTTIITEIIGMVEELPITLITEEVAELLEEAYLAEEVHLQQDVLRTV